MPREWDNGDEEPLLRVRLYGSADTETERYSFRSTDGSTSGGPSGGRYGELRQLTPGCATATGRNMRLLGQYGQYLFISSFNCALNCIALI
jgi:hypothetical protein